MTIKIIDADDLGKDGIRLTVDLDADAPGEPADENGRLLVRQWGSYESSRNDGETQVQYRNRIKAEMRALAREAAALRQSAIKPTKIASLIGADIS
jgi:hypothetical protein